MLKFTAVVMMTSLLPVLATQAAQAAPACGKHDDVVKALDAKYHEGRQALGLANGLTVFELFVSGAGTWTMVVTDTSGRSCLVASGEAWQASPVTVAGLDS